LPLGVQNYVAVTTRDHALIRLLYYGGLRISELIALRWRSLVSKDVGGAINVFGKGGKSRIVRLTGETWAEVHCLRQLAARMTDRIFPMSAWNAWDRVRRASERAGVVASPHYLRHSHATHALHRGADIACSRHARPCESSDHEPAPTRASYRIKRRLIGALAIARPLSL